MKIIKIDDGTMEKFLQRSQLDSSSIVNIVEGIVSNVRVMETRHSTTTLKNLIKLTLRIFSLKKRI